MTLTLKKLLTAIAGALGIISLFLPWYKVSFWGNSLSANAFGGDYTWIAIINIIIAILLVALIFVPEKTLKSMNKVLVEKANIIIIVASGVFAVLTLLAMIMYTSSSYGMGHMGFGWYLALIAGIAGVVINVLKVKQLDKVVTGSEKKPAAKKTEKK
ncbi:hypothetical protein IKF27_01000 [Candidatus Saccharibacteria bacterium]|nr:hypothetical protein [Candidatus Saccharibacteria bacterium]